MKKMKLSEIKIHNSFAESIPSEEKMEECRYNWRMYHRQDRYIVVDNDNILVDGYCMYLVLMEHKEEYAEVKIWHCKKKRWVRKNVKDWEAPRYVNNPTIYVYGVHPNSKNIKRYIWRVPETWNDWADNLQIGDIVMCATKFGCSPVVIEKISMLDKCPVNFKVKKVCNKKIIRNGMVLEL